MADDLVGLAQRLVDLTGQVEDVRRQMFAALANGAGHGAFSGAGDPTPARPTQRASRPAKPPPLSATMARAKEAEDRLVAMLQERPMTKAEIITATGASEGTVADRLRRLQLRGTIERGSNGWSATATS
jgi:predicted Rossmann fold nucleotide-binding protein DprA/Smf involved in DNA uptake